MARAWRAAVARTGSRVFCGCCGNTSRWFLPYGERPGVVCAHCGAFDRHRVLWPRLRPLLGPGVRVLHFAPESAIARRILDVPGVVYVAADLNPDSRSLSCETELVQADIMRQPWADDSFDLVVVSHVLEHVTDDIQAMRELRRVLTSAGRVVSHHPSDPGRERTFEDPSVVTREDRLRVFGQADHARIYGRDLPDRWRSAGFEVTIFGPGALEARPLPAAR